MSEIKQEEPKLPEDVPLTPTMASLSIGEDGRITPTRQADLSELDTPISKTALAEEANDSILNLPAPLTGSRPSKSNLSVTSSMYSVASGLVNTSAPVEDLAGLVVQMAASDEESLAKDSISLRDACPFSERSITERSSPRESISQKRPPGSGTTLTDAMKDLKRHLDKTMIELRDQSRRDFEKVLSVLQQESAKRTALEGRLHSQLLMQSETMVAMELKLLRLEAKVERREAAQRSQRSRPSFQTIDEEFGSIRVDTTRGGSRLPPPPRQGGAEPTNIAVISSGASLASGVTEEEKYMEDTGEHHSDDDGFGGSDSTPQSRGNPFGSSGALESILLNPMIGDTNMQGTSVRAIRGDNDGNSSLATSMTNVTNSTLTSTVITATTRGESVNRNRGGVMEEGSLLEEGTSMMPPRHSSLDDVGFPAQRLPRSRSQSPLTVQSLASQGMEPQSVTSASLGPSILSSAAVAPPRTYGSRRVYAAATGTNINGDSRPLANRVVSFTTENLQVPQDRNYSEAGDSITMPDELDNLSEVADTFATSARVWREEYESRLDSLQKRWSAE